MFSFSHLLNLLLVANTATAAFVSRSRSTGGLDLLKRAPTSCPIDTQPSCSLPSVSNQCCTESPGGLLLLTQFWNAEPFKSIGPADEWTLHGLWPNGCSNEIIGDCDTSRKASNITALLTEHGATSTLEYMEQHWLEINNKNDGFWAHEWNKHGTCLSTLGPSCLAPSAARRLDAVLYFQTTIELFKTRLTYQLLQSEGIVPTKDREFTLVELKGALKRATGAAPKLNCTSKSGASYVTEAFWFFHLKGSAIDGEFIPIDAPESVSSCPDTGLRYWPKKIGSTPPSTTPTPSGTPGELPARSVLRILQTGVAQGGLIGVGNWSQQTPASFRFNGTTESFTLSSNRGQCAASSGALVCNTDITQGDIFSAVADDTRMLLAYNGSSVWSSDAIPRGSGQQTIFLGSGHPVSFNVALEAGRF